MNADFLRDLDQRAQSNRPLKLWLRDDDVVAPTAALDRLLQAAESRRIPLTLAAIPKFADLPLADRLAQATGVCVAVHGWCHANHAGPGEKTQELGAHRPVAVVVGDLRQGFARLRTLFAAQFVPVLVPPWNRVAPLVVAELPALGFQALSVFGPSKAGPLPMINTQVDVIDWRGTRGGRAEDDLLADIVRSAMQGHAVGILSHHLVHDAQAWRFLDRLFAQTADHPGCQWLALPSLLASP